MDSEQEKKDKRKGAIVALGIHALLLILFAFIMAWREPDPPLPEYGIEINFGNSAVGSGQQQPEQPTNEPEEVVEPLPDEPVESDAEEVPEEVVEEAVQETVEETVETTNNVQESPVVAKKAKEEPKKEEKPKETPKKEVEKKEKPKPKPKKEGVKWKKRDGGNGKGDSNKTPSGSQGNDTNKSGDKGSPNGELNDATVYKGTKGGGSGGNGTGISGFDGWNIKFDPNPPDNTNENGVLEFEVEIDDNGDIVKLRVLERGVSPTLEKIYRTEVYNKLNAYWGKGGAPPARSKGRIKFIIRSK